MPLQANFASRLGGLLCYIKPYFIVYRHKAVNVIRVIDESDYFRDVKHRPACEKGLFTALQPVWDIVPFEHIDKNDRTVVVSEKCRCLLFVSCGDTAQKVILSVSAFTAYNADGYT